MSSSRAKPEPRASSDNGRVLLSMPVKVVGAAVGGVLLLINIALQLGEYVAKFKTFDKHIEETAPIRNAVEAHMQATSPHLSEGERELVNALPGNIKNISERMNGMDSQMRDISSDVDALKTLVLERLPRRASAGG